MVLLNGTEPCKECPIRKFDDDVSGAKKMSLFLARLAPWGYGLEQCMSLIVGGGGGG